MADDVTTERLKELLEKATPGPWNFGSTTLDNYAYTINGPGSREAGWPVVADVCQRDPAKYSAALIALAPTLAADLLALRAKADALAEARDHQQRNKNQAYEERNRLVALLASMFPAGRAVTDIPGWNPEWHGCVYIDFPWGQASWHFHDSQAHLFAHLPPYSGEWDGHTTEAKYEAIARAALAAYQEDKP